MNSVRLLLFLSSFLILSQPVPAQDSAKKSCDRRFTVSLTNFEPFAYRERGRLKGLAHDVIEAIKEKTGCQFAETETPRSQSVEQINRGRVDILSLIVKSSDYEKGGVFIPFYMSSREISVAKKFFSKNKKIEDYLADEKIKFAYMIGNRAVLSEAEEIKLFESISPCRNSRCRRRISIVERGTRSGCAFFVSYNELLFY